jgi:hypothetical protein
MSYAATAEVTIHKTDPARPFNTFVCVDNLKMTTLIANHRAGRPTGSRATPVASGSAVCSYSSPTARAKTERVQHDPA